MLLAELTTTQLERLYHKALDRMMAGKGYQPTLRLTSPRWVLTLQRISVAHSEVQRLGVIEVGTPLRKGE